MTKGFYTKKKIVTFAQACPLKLHNIAQKVKLASTVTSEAQKNEVKEQGG